MSVLAMRAQRAFTLIEMLVVVVILGTVLALVAPSFREMILMKRLSGINSQLVTDLQFARSEAAARNAHMRVTFGNDGTMTCYSIYTYTSNASFCDCTLTPACTAGEGTVEVRTVRIPRDSIVRVAPVAGMPVEFAFEPITGALWKIPTDFISPPLSSYVVEATVNSSIMLRDTISLSGRPTVCAPSGSKMQVTSC